ncbi:MAG TPA: exodeoxyribonuclease VII small subunit [Flavobacteriales bacterium]|jgi:exodeoxyribonuclease VII small subunit|nr:exodeoxyribonuclease VII small subunit [Flavobacteriales bacterium]
MTPPNLDSTDIPEKFDDALAELRQLMQVLEGEDISIDTLTQSIRRASILLKHCQKQLQATEEEVKTLIQELGMTAGEESAEGAQD